MNRNILITGASSGIGKSIAYKFAKNKDNIIIHYNNGKEKAISLANELSKKYGVIAYPIKCNLESEEEIKKMVKEIEENFNTIDVLINNAGIAIDTIFEDKTKDNFQKTLNINLIAPFLLSKYISKKMLENKKGSIINISSTNSINSYYPFSMDYDASKAGLNLLTKNLAVELSPYIRVNAIAPGWVNTPMNQGLDTQFIKKEQEKIALKRFAEPDEIANIALFLASDEASYINGSIIIADGGRI